MDASDLINHEIADDLPFSLSFSLDVHPSTASGNIKVYLHVVFIIMCLMQNHNA